jgi:hypothetical protein
MSQSRKNDYSEEESSRRFEAALRGAFKTPLPPRNVTPKKPEAQQQKGKPTKDSPSGASRASAKTGKP